MNPLYNRLMAEKGAPRAANNPNTTQLHGAPMNLRSAMQKYAIGGGVGFPPPSAGDINSFVQANLGNPQAIMQAAQQYGVSMDDLANATGYSSNQINDYFGNAGLGSFGTKPTPPSVEGSGTFNVTPPPSEIPTRPGMPDEFMFNPPEPANLPPKSGQPPYDYGSVPESERGGIDKALKTLQNPPQMAPSSTLPPELLQKIAQQLSQGASNPFGSEITQQDELLKLLKALKVQ
jgi:hypothetical protein